MRALLPLWPNEALWPFSFLAEPDALFFLFHEIFSFSLCLGLVIVFFDRPSFCFSIGSVINYKFYSLSFGDSSGSSSIWGRFL